MISGITTKRVNNPTKTKEAQSFYKALKEGYPDSPEAKKVK